jgi:hypothetical protein
MPIGETQTLSHGHDGIVEPDCRSKPADFLPQLWNPKSRWPQVLWPTVGIAVVVASVCFVYKFFLVAPWRAYSETQTFNGSGASLRPVTAAGELLRWLVVSHDGVSDPVTKATLAAEVVGLGRDHDKARITNVALHMLATLLLFAVIRKVTANIVLASCVAAVFAAHPAVVEAVAWLPGRSELVGAVLALAALLFYLDFAQRGGKFQMYAAASLSLGACFATPTLVALPFMFLLVESTGRAAQPQTTPGMRPASGAVTHKSRLWFVVGSTVVAVAMWAQISGGGPALAGGAAMPVRFAEISVVCGAQMCRAVLPHFGWWQLPGSPIGFWALASGSLVLLLGLSFLGWRRQRYEPVICGAWLFFVVTAFSVAARRAVDAENAFVCFYIPLIGLVTVGVLTVSKMLPAGATRDALLPLLVLANVVILGRMAHADAARCADQWDDFVTSVHESEPISSEPLLLDDSGPCSDHRWIDAMTAIDATLAGNSDEPTLLLQRANALEQLNCIGAASAQYRLALEGDDNNFKAHYKIGGIFLWKGQRAEAERHFWRALEIKPSYAVAYVGIARICDGRGEHFQAREYLRRALELDPSLRSQHAQRTQRMFPDDHLDDTIERLSRSLDHSPNSPDAIALDVATALQAAPQALASGSGSN